MTFSELASLVMYVGSILLFRTQFDQRFIQSFPFYWKVVVLTLVSCVPLYFVKLLRRKFAPPNYSKLTE